MSNLLLIPLEDTVVFPSMSVTLTVDVGDAERVLLVPVHEGEYARVGTVAEVASVLRLPGGGLPSRRRARTQRPPVRNEVGPAATHHHTRRTPQ